MSIRTSQDDVKDGPEALWNAVRSALRFQRGGPPLEIISRDEPLPASFAQQRIWFLERLAPASPLHNLAIALRLAGPLSAQCLEQSLSEMVKRHEVFRTTFHFADGQLFQTIHPPPVLALPVVDLRSFNASDREQEMVRRSETEAREPFDLDRPPLIRARLFTLSDLDHLLVLTMHHLAFDGWSFTPFMRELCALYGAFISGKPSPLPDLHLQYADFAVWQRRRLDAEARAPLLEYWKEQMRGSLPILRLPADRSRSLDGRRGACQSFTVSKGLSEALKHLSVEEGVTPFMTLLAAFQTLLYRYTGEEDIVVGSPIANRNRAEIDGLIGLFVNTLALRTWLGNQPSFRELLAQVRDVVLGAYSHQDLPFEMLVEALVLERQPNSSPVFQVMFAYQNVPQTVWELPGLRADATNIETGTAKFDITLFMWDTEEGFGGSVEYDTELFDAATIIQFLGHFRTLIEGIVRDADQSIAAIPLLSVSEMRWLVDERNDTAIDYPRDMAIHSVFEAQVRRAPERIALAFGSREITYAELDRRANQLARYLVKASVRSGMLVGVCLEVSPSFIVALLAILKTGAAYVPVDPSAPGKHIAETLKNAALTVVVTEMAVEDRLSGGITRLVCLDSEQEEIDRESDEHLELEVSADSLAYVMYTSGSTGTPKGVCISHRGVVRLVKGANYASLTSEEVFLQVAPLSFDLSTFEIWGSLLNGARLALPSIRRPSLKDIAALIRFHRVSILLLTPGLFELLVDTHLPELAPVRQLLVCGDVLSVPHAERFKLQVTHCRLINCYGPTECTTFASFYPVEGGQGFADGTIPIGRPISNTQMYVLDRFHQPVPIGVVGEAYIGGDGVMQGYLNDAALTRERLVRNPFSDQPGTFLYKTGDLVRYRRDGNIEFLSRTDDQVKIRGFRVEPGQVEDILSRCPFVKRVAVIARSSTTGGRRLVAYVVPETAGQNSHELVSALRDFTRERLPHYLVPSEFVLLETLPLKTNGKVDRAALPPPVERMPARADISAGPRDEMDRLVSEAFEQVLGIRSVGMADSFFDLGGDSLMALRLFATIEDTLNMNLPLVSLFEHQTVSGFAAFLRRHRNGNSERLHRSENLGSSLVEIKRGQSEMPFFLVPGGSGGMAEMTFYARLMTHLDVEQSVYGLLATSLDGAETSHASVAERAASHLMDIRRLQPRGPYAIGGECVGGIVAFEMAQQLIAQGENVAMLLLMDTWCPIDVARFRSRHFDRPLAILKSRWSIARVVLSNLRRVLRDEVRDQPSAYPVRWFRHWLDVTRTLKGKTMSWLGTLKHIEQTMRYRPQIYPGWITLMISSNNDRKGISKDWRRLGTSGLVVHMVSGDHESYIRETPEEAAKQFRNCLDEAKSRR